MPTNTPTAQQLWDDSSNYRRVGGPGMPLQMEHPRNNNTADPFVNYGWDHPHAAATLRDHGLQFLIENGHRPDPHIDTPISYSCSWQSPGERHDCPGPTMLAAINATIGAVLDARKGEKP